tara:strand:+ start:5729 stop:5920 length:192 start_codon:yes stop_codon:yes gene_type:complete
MIMRENIFDIRIYSINFIFSYLKRENGENKTMCILLLIGGLTDLIQCQMTFGVKCFRSYQNFY